MMEAEAALGTQPPGWVLAYLPRATLLLRLGNWDGNWEMEPPHLQRAFPCGTCGTISQYRVSPILFSCPVPKCHRNL